MNKRMREILALIQEKTAEAKGFMSGENKDVAKANAIMDEVAELKSEYETAKRIFEAEKGEGMEGADPHPGNGTPEVKELTGEEIVAKEIRSIMTHVADKDLVESVEADGGSYHMPVRKRKKRTPSAYKSVAGVTPRPARTSGARSK